MTEQLAKLRTLFPPNIDVPALDNRSEDTVFDHGPYYELIIQNRRGMTMRLTNLEGPLFGWAVETQKVLQQCWKPIKAPAPVLP